MKSLECRDDILQKMSTKKETQEQIDARETHEEQLDEDNFREVHRIYIDKGQDIKDDEHYENETPEQAKQRIRDYSYRGTWEHAFSRAINKARRNDLTKIEMLQKYGRFPKKNEWWNDVNQEDWIAAYRLKFPKP